MEREWKRVERRERVGWVGGGGLGEEGGVGRVKAERGVWVRRMEWRREEREVMRILVVFVLVFFRRRLMSLFVLEAGGIIGTLSSLSFSSRFLYSRRVTLE